MNRREDFGSRLQCRFAVSIALGNDAMQTPQDVAKALREIAEKLDTTGPSRGPVIDRNGNTVGTFTLTGRWEE